MDKFKTLLKLTFVILLLYYLFHRGFISVQATAQALSQWDKVIPAALASLIGTALGIIRWQLLLRAQNIHLKWSRIFQLTFIGNFFNIALPGAVSGDFVKAIYVGKESGGHKTRAFGSILFDRVAGLSALVFVSTGALALGLDSFLHAPVLAGIGFFLGISATTVLLFYAYLFLVREHHDPLLWAFRWIEKRIPKLRSLTLIYESLRHYHNHRWEVIQVLALSIIIHLMVGWSSYQYALALGESHVSLISLYLIVPLGLLITAIPIAPAGVGTGNVAFLYLFHLIGSDRGADTFSLIALNNILIGAIGGLIYFRFRGHEEATRSVGNNLSAVASP